MTVQISLWMIPTALTLLIWGAAVALPTRAPMGGDYNFGPAFEALTRGVVSVVATLVVWLVYFIIV